MSIKIKGNVVVNDDRKAKLSTLNPGVYTTSTLPQNPEVGDFLYNSEEETIQVWNGQEWV